MKSALLLIPLTLCLAFAQTPALTGVWKANLEKSKFAGPPLKNYLVLINRTSSGISLTIGSYGERGEQRSSFSYDLSGKQSMNSYRGMPMRTDAAVNGNVVTLNSDVAGHPAKIAETYTLAPDGNTLTIASTTTANSKETQQLIVLEKQPDNAGEDLRKPEAKAGDRFKNIQLLKDVPASQFMDIMRSFTVSLGAECDFCHVQGNFSSDDKQTKLMARTMLTMTNNINQQTFHGERVVHCFTCHKGQHEPQSRPAFQ